MRKEGWEVRLQSLLEEAETRKYELGKADCFRLACEVVEALTGRPSRWDEWRGRYHDTRSALKLIGEHGGFRAAFSWFFGSAPIEVKFAQRGDICAWQDKTSMRHLGVCTGRKVALVGESSLFYVPLTDCEFAWRIE